VPRALGIWLLLALACCAPAAAVEVVHVEGLVAPCLRYPSERVVAVGPEAAVIRRGGTLIACDRPGNARRLMVRPFPLIPNAGGGAYHVTVAGDLVAYATYSFCTVCGGGSSDWVRLFSARSGPVRVLRTIRGRPSEHIDLRVRAIALNACGTVAYMAAARSPFGGRDLDRELYLWTDDRSAPVLLERGPVELGSLRVTDRGVLWRSRGGLRGRRLGVGCAHPAG
jgi:hypothetical protein